MSKLKPLSFVQCRRCAGSGWVTMSHTCSDGFFEAVDVPCLSCRGTGQVFAPAVPAESASDRNRSRDDAPPAEPRRGPGAGGGIYW